MNEKDKEKRTKKKEETRLFFTGRLSRKEDGHIQIELMHGMILDVLEEDVSEIKEFTDPETQRTIVSVGLKAEKQISAVLQPYLYRVIAGAEALPFAFMGRTKVPPDQFVIPDIETLGMGGDWPTNCWSETQTRSQDWAAGWHNDDNKFDVKHDESLPHPDIEV